MELDPLALLSRLVHTVCASTLLGGLIYMRCVLAPAASESAESDVLFAGRRQAWSKAVSLATLLLIVSGLYNFYLAMTSADLPGQYHMAFGLKFLLAFVIFALMALLAGKTTLAERLRAKLGFWLNLALVLTVAVYLLGAILRQTPRPAKTMADTPATQTVNQ